LQLLDVHLFARGWLLVWRIFSLSFLAYLFVAHAVAASICE